MDIYKFGQNAFGRGEDIATGDKLIIRDVSQAEDNNGIREATFAQVDVFRNSAGAFGAGTLLATPTRTVSPRLVHSGGVLPMATADGTNNATNSGSGSMYLCECFVPCNMTVTGISVYNGTAVAGNGKVALYSYVSTTATRLAVSASTAFSGTTAYQKIDFTAPVSIIGPATYFMGITCDTTTHDIRTHVLGNFACEEVTGITYATNTTFATLTVVGTAFNAGMGLYMSFY